MRVLFLTIGLPDMSGENGGLYADMIKELSGRGYEMTAIAPSLPEQDTGVFEEGGVTVLRVKIGQMQGDIPLSKKIANVLSLTPLYKRAFRKYLWDKPFDWVVMPTPPSSMVDIVEFIVKRTGAKFYLLLRDIHPESKRRFPSRETLARTDVYDECKKPYSAGKLMYWFLKRESQKAYRLADLIGCMSPANISFVQSIAPYVDQRRIVLLPNWYREPFRSPLNTGFVREKYGLEGKFIAIFGGTVGEGQAVWNIASLAKHNLWRDNVVFVVVGRGVKMPVLKQIAKDDGLTNIVFFDYMPKDEYEALLAAADLGLISIDEKFPVPTSPSKVIGYMALHQPVLAMINRANDYGDFYLGSSGCGLWSVDLDYSKMYGQFDWFVEHDQERKAMGEAGYEYFKNNFTVEVVANLFEEQLKNA